MSLLNATTLTVVIPIDLTRRTQEIMQRAENFAKNSRDFIVIFGCRKLSSKDYLKFKKVIGQYSHCHIAEAESQNIALSNLRNVAIDKVTTEWILFLDVDIFPDFKLFNYLLDEVKVSKFRLVMIPCLYLSRKGQVLLKSKHAQPSQLVDFFYQFRRDLIQHLAFPSSIIISDIDSVRHIEGFDESYLGHGYEDFDFMLRLFAYKKIIDLSSIDFRDIKYNSVLLMQGFRYALAVNFLKYLAEKKYAIHQYHSKFNEESYYQLRKYNGLIFNKKFSLSVTTKNNATTFEENNLLGGVDYSRYLLHDFIAYCFDQDIDLIEYSALFDPMPGHMWRSYDMRDYMAQILRILKV